MLLELHFFHFSFYFLYFLLLSGLTGCCFILNRKFDSPLKAAYSPGVFFSCFFVPHLSPDAEIKYLQSLVNFIPVTISAGQETFLLDRCVKLGDRSQIYNLTRACSVTRMSKHRGHTFPGDEIKDADVFVGAAGGHVLAGRIKLYL